MLNSLMKQKEYCKLNSLLLSEQLDIYLLSQTKSTLRIK